MNKGRILPLTILRCNFSVFRVYFYHTGRFWLYRWAGTQYLLSVTADAFTAAHTNALRYMRRAETSERDDNNILIPLAWHDGRVARVTFSRPSE